MFDYEAKQDSPGGFQELSLTKGIHHLIEMACPISSYFTITTTSTIAPGQMLEYLGEHNEHWWKAKNEEGMEGCVPSSYVILKSNVRCVVPWWWALYGVVWCLGGGHYMEWCGALMVGIMWSGVVSWWWALRGVVLVGIIWSGVTRHLL